VSRGANPDASGAIEMAVAMRAAARARGRNGGRPPKIKKCQLDHAKRLLVPSGDGFAS
jgi:hypothetical protein